MVKTPSQFTDVMRRAENRGSDKENKFQLNVIEKQQNNFPPVIIFQTGKMFFT